MGSTEVIKQEPKAVVQVASAQSLIEMAITQNADIDKLEKLMALQERYDAKNAKSAYLLALSMFQSKCPVIVAKKQGHNYKYAPLGDIVAQIKELLFHCGLSYRFEQSQEGKSIKIRCITSHIEGHTESLTIEGEADTQGSKSSIQAIGSTITYLRRYSLLGALGIVTADEDSDGRVESSKKIDHCDSAQVIKINELIEKTGVDLNNFGSLVNQTFGINCSSFAQYTKEQADFAIKKLESKL
ncbi:MAG: ERF family protein [Colwellia sp.]|nr:ERF family protein [Colwellia sp.]